jgi:hypothetical protein
MYYRAVLSNGNCSGFSAVASIKSPSTTYNGTWSNGAPDATKKLHLQITLRFLVTLLLVL